MNYLECTILNFKQYTDMTDTNPFIICNINEQINILIQLFVSYVDYNTDNLETWIIYIDVLFISKL